MPMKHLLLSLLAVLCLSSGAAAVSTRGSSANDTTTPNATPLIYRFAVRGNIAPSTVRLVSRCLAEARDMNASYVLLELNTYGGMVESADSVRTSLLRSSVPVLVLIDNQAASAGALISLAADSIYMVPGASIGAATVVNGNGEVMPDKYQSFMRGMMRATAESHGKVPSAEGGDTVQRWRRDPRIAEAMVDPGIAIEGLTDSGRVVTFTAEEAERWGFSEGRCASAEELCDRLWPGAEIYEFRPSAMDRVMGFLMNPIFQGIMIVLVIGGIYFELQTPGVGFPLAAAAVGALFYFAPLYVEGLAANWELLLFLAGIVLVLVEIFVTPGFGLPGVAGIAAIVAGLTFAMLDADILRFVWRGELTAAALLRPLCTVVTSVTAGMVASIWLGRKFLTGDSPLQRRVVLTTEMTPEEGFVSHSADEVLTGAAGVTRVPLRPAGKVDIGGKTYEASSEDGSFVERGVRVVVRRREGGVIYVEPEKDE